MKRSELGKVLDRIKSNYYIQTYIEWKDSEESYSYDCYNNAIAYIAGICDMLALDDLISERQVNELYRAIIEYMDTGKKSSKRLDALFDEMRKGVEK